MNLVEEHFRLYTLAAVKRLEEQAALTLGSRTELLERFEFLGDYSEAIRDCPDTPPAAWEQNVTDHLPLRALRRQLGLSERALTMLFATGLIEEDSRFGAFFSAFQDEGQSRPAVGLFTAWWRDDESCNGVRADLQVLVQSGLLHTANPDAPRLSWILQPPHALWDCLRGAAPSQPAPGMRYIPAGELPELKNLLLGREMLARVASLPQALHRGLFNRILVRGSAHNGRRTVLCAIARELGMPVLELQTAERNAAERSRLAGALAIALNAFPIAVYGEADTGEQTQTPLFGCYVGPAGILPPRGRTVSVEEPEKAVTLTLDVPDAGVRQSLWTAGLGEARPELPATLAAAFRMTSGNILRAAAVSRARVEWEERPAVTPHDVSLATRELATQGLGPLARWLAPCGSWERMAARADLMDDLRRLETRCRYREALGNVVGPALQDQMNAGVRAIFSGPSGTGKTLAARLLAGSLGKDLYRIDLAAVVSKYIGETEKNLNQVLNAAEEYDVMLLLDEGDALLANRTAVQSSVDRYANLETNFLLQRLESYEGILIVTTNSPQSIDSAFQRRMDAVVEFHVPEPAERFTILQLHLPLDHRIDYSHLEEIAVRCVLSGGQIRNAVLHAALLSLEQSSPVTYERLERAVLREYSRTGSVCPLRRTASAAARL